MYAVNGVICASLEEAILIDLKRVNPIDISIANVRVGI